MSSRASIILCTYNRAPMLRRCLQSLACQTLGPETLEILVVDDGSQDNTQRVLQEMSRQMPNLRHLSTSSNSGLAGAANLGVRSASADALLFIDDDCVATENWAKHMCAALDEAPIATGAIATPTDNYIKLCHNISQFHAFMPERAAGETDFVVGANMAFRRKTLESLGGFDETDRVAPDTAIAFRARLAGHRALFVPDAVVTHDPDRTDFPTIFRYSAAHASVTVLLRNRYAELLHTPFLLRSAFLIALMSPLLALRVTAGIYLGNRRLLQYPSTVPTVFALKLAWCWGAIRGLQQNASSS